MGHALPMDLLYKPIVLECGHVSCFWCVHNSMDAIHESHCPICRHPYHHFPTICEMMHFLLSKMYPLAYKRREKQILEEETVKNCFSPQLDCKELKSSNGSIPSHDSNMLSGQASSSCITRVDKDSSNMDSNCSASIKERDLPAIERVSSSGVLCPACEQLLYRPAVLNCGHVYCEACIVVPEDGIIICKVCDYPHPSDCPNVCLELNNFLEEQFPIKYSARRKSVEEKQARFQHKNPSSCSISKKSTKKGFITPYRGSEEFIPWWSEHGSKVHAGAGCDYCGMYPIVGDRYRCQDCVELIGFDLCGDCYNTQSKRPGRFNQQHTADHRFELVKQPDFLRNIMLRLVGGNLVDSSGAPVLAVNAIEDPPDGWIAVESVDDLENIHNNVAAADETVGDILHDDSDTQDGSIEVEFSDALEFSDNNVTSLSHHDHNNMDQDGNDDPPF
ncbi:E3 ubiquitin-protein ligase PRT1 isoform X2 [Spinacia oleracea]|uniref:E3 ubiquitin-protein ligase PRT1 isoform X2 n=1 Tax=Spinacia oleracea TaxID=3562 RepID=A0ABM3QUN3_SPIOL|nr:E3 ubiquitin-protein ligase PRT1 isoform X2 [Spinacia oleracea]